MQVYDSFYPQAQYVHDAAGRITERSENGQSYYQLWEQPDRLRRVSWGINTSSWSSSNTNNRSSGNS